MSTRLMHARSCLLVAFMVLFAGSSVRCETVDGFVTAVESTTTFSIGSMHVALGKNTLCSTVPMTTAEVRHNFLWNNFRYLPPEYTGNDSAGATVPACQTIRLTIGIWVHMEGSSRPNDSVWIPDLLVEYQYPLAVERLQSCSLLEETPQLTHTEDGPQGTVWVDGYPMQYQPTTQLFRAPVTTEVMLAYPLFHSAPYYGPFHGFGRPVLTTSANQVEPNAWACYRAGKTVSQKHALTRLTVWPNANGAGKQKTKAKAFPALQPPDYTRGIPGTLHLDKKTAVQIIPSDAVQSYVSHIGEKVIPRYEAELSAADQTRVSFHFYVIPHMDRRTESWIGMQYYFIENVEHFGGRNYNNWVLALPDGTIIITDTQLARLHNTAQLAALLSFAVTSVLQRQTYIRLEFTSRNDGGPDSTRAGAFWQDSQRLRIGIRQMYLAGYDIREAPFAWALTSGKPSLNPVINSASPNTQIPWYTAYAFNTISQFYSDIDYSKLKRGEAEYAQFLEELRKADPEAFAEKK